MSDKKFSYQELTDKLIRFCDYQERSIKEARQKLKRLGLESEKEQNEIISYVKDLGYLDEERFAKSFASGKYRIKKWGLIRIKRELRLKGVSDELIDSTLEQIDFDGYADTFQELAERKWESIKAPDLYQKKGKLFRFLYNRGYEKDLINEFLRSVT